MAKIFDKINLVKNTSVNDNLLINGNFDIWQRGVSFSNNGFTADRWYLGIVSGGTRVYKMTGGNSLTNTTSFARIESLSANNTFTFAQPVESTIVSQIRGSYVTLTFYAKLPTTSNWSGNIKAKCQYSNLIDNLTTNRTPIETSYIDSSITKNNEWQKYSVSFLVPSNANTLLIEIYTDTSQSVGSILDIAQVKLEQGQSITPLSPIVFSEELLKCKRYYQKLEAKLKAGTGFSGGNTPRKFSIGIPLQNAPRSSNPVITRIVSESNDVALSNIGAIFSSNNILNISADSSSPHSELSSIFTIEDEIFPARAPGVIPNLDIIRSGTTINAYWNPAPDFGSRISNYILYYGTTPILLNNTISSTGLSGVISGLDSISPYYLRIAAVNNIGIGDLSSLYYSGPYYGIPSGLQSVTGTWGNDTTNLSWTRPLNDGGASITGYVVDRSMYSNYSIIESRYYTTNTTSSIAKSISQITATGTYYYRVAALNIAGTGTYTNFALPKTTPFPPNNLSTTAQNGSVLISYGLPSGNGGDTISSINIQYSSSSNFTASTGVTGVLNYNPITISPLTNGTTIYFRARNLNGIGYGSYSQTASAVPNRPLTVPGVSTNLNAAWRNDSYTSSGINNIFNLQWTAPVDDGGSPIINYTVFLAADGGFSSGLGTYNTINSNRSIDIISPTGLSNIYIRLKTNNSIGAGSYSSGISISDQLPLAPSLLSITAGDSAGLVTYIPPSCSCGSPVTGYAIEYSTVSNFNTLTRIMLPSGSCNQYTTFFTKMPCSKSIIGLTNNTLYYTRIKAINNIGTGIASNIMTVTPIPRTTAPSQPLNVSINRFKTLGTSLNTTAIILSYNPISMVSYADSNSIYAIPVVGSTLGNIWGCGPYTHDSTISKAAVHAGILSNGQAGTVYVQMLPGYSSYSSCLKNGITSSSFAIWNKSYNLLGLSICSNNDGATISWESPTNMGGSAITGYVVQTGATSSFGALTSTNSAIVPVALSYSSCATKENFYTRVAAINSVGTGVWSDTILTLQNYLLAPSAPAWNNISYSGTLNNVYRLNLSWVAPTAYGGTASLTSYKLSFFKSSDINFGTDDIRYLTVSGNVTGISYDIPSPGTWDIGISANNGSFQSNYNYSRTVVANTGSPAPLSWTFSTQPGSVAFTDISITNTPTQADLSRGNLTNKQYGSYITYSILNNITGNSITADFGQTTRIMGIRYAPVTFTNTLLTYRTAMGNSTIQGSNNQTNWTTLGTFPSGSYLTKLDTTGDYRYIRLFTPINSSYHSYIQAGKFYFI